MRNFFNLSVEASEREEDKTHREKLKELGLLTAKGSKLSRDQMFTMAGKQGNV